MTKKRKEKLKHLQRMIVEISSFIDDDITWDVFRAKIEGIMRDLRKIEVKEAVNKTKKETDETAAQVLEQLSDVIRMFGPIDTNNELPGVLHRGRMVSPAVSVTRIPAGTAVTLSTEEEDEDD
jgi:hypothetical protein